MRTRVLVRPARSAVTGPYSMLGVSLQPAVTLRLLLLLCCCLSACEKKLPPQPGQPSLVAPSEPSEVIPPEPPLELVRVPNSGLPCAVDDVLAAKCRRCHSVPARHSAPFPLLTWEDTQQLIDVRPRFKVLEKVVQTGYMPYGIPANPPVQPLTDAEKQTLLAWARAGAPRGGCGAPAATESARLPERSTLVLKGVTAPPPHTH